MPIFYDTVPGRSSFIRRLGLVLLDSSSEIHVTMAGRRTYVYSVPHSMYWNNFKNAGSKGKYYNNVIRRRFDYKQKY